MRLFIRFCLPVFLFTILPLKATFAVPTELSSKIKINLCALLLGQSENKPTVFRIETTKALSAREAYEIAEKFADRDVEVVLEGWEKASPKQKHKGIFVFTIRTLKDIKELGREIFKNENVFAKDEADPSTTKPTLELTAWIDAYVSQNYPGESGVGVRSFLVGGVLADPLFQSDPMGYLKSWEELRGNGETFEFLYDPALEFLKAVKTAGLLERLARASKDAGLSLPAGKTPLSSKWVTL